MVDHASKERGYEVRDISVRAIAWCAAALVVAAVVTHLALAGLYKLFEHQHPSPEAPSRIAFQTQMIAPLPQLQTNPQVDLAAFGKKENEKLNSYGWLNKDAGVVHIPIQRAIDLVTQRGLPTRGSGTQNASGITPVQMQEQKAAATKP